MTNQNNIKIALIGKAGSGKNTFLDIARKLHPIYDFKELKLAEPIYKCMYSIQEIVGIEPHKDGKLLQLIGQHYRYTVDQDFWIRKLLNKLPKDNVILTDCRFPNEARKLKEDGFILIRINRDVEKRRKHLGNRDPNHPSEAEMNKIPKESIDFEIDNNEDVEVFTIQCGMVLKVILKSMDLLDGNIIKPTPTLA